MIVQDRKGNWVLRVYTQNPGENFKVTCEQYYKTRDEMRDGVKLWKNLTRHATTKVKIKTYRLLGDLRSDLHHRYDRVWYKETR